MVKPYLDLRFYVSNTRKTWENVINIIQMDVKYNSNFYRYFGFSREI